ncbi:MAG: thioredoxin domain-containing protein [Actinobacteria bacterium]|nr:thioredoxin domain-containing protein [Actinomycetota bacterium]
MDKISNHLILEKSPYLLQHAHNPVNWYPWSKEVFEKALAEDKPVFLSIGYSTCHWCHVMEKESFEDVEVAKLMNEVFVSIKVDREERPDIDKIYMEFCQMLTGSGGWPLTIVMTPDKKPFFAATYIPKQNKYGRTGMLTLIPQVKELWLNKRSDIIKSSENIIKHFSKQNISISGKSLDESIMDLTFDHLNQLYDMTNGGFGTSPKFPTMHHIYFLLRYWKRTKNEYALKMVEKTINAMRSGGIWDHIGFGFHRYSTDEKWIVPHFEKMLYDQALVSIGCIETFQATRNNFYKNIAEEIFEYVLRDMTSKEGGFYSAEDADSEGVEGKFYTWNIDEIKKIFPEPESDMIIDIFNVGVSSLESGSVLYINKPLEDIALKYNLSLKNLNGFIQAVRKKLFDKRKKRIHPFKDDKILTDWNGLMISALAIGARVFGKKIYEKTAAAAADFIISNLITKEGFLLHRYRDGQSAISANLDDYAFFIMGLLELYETNFNRLYLEIALQLNKVVIENFWDSQNRGFYFAQNVGELKNFRLKDAYDGAIPSGNSILLLNLIKLGRITVDLDFEEKAMLIVRAFSKLVEKTPEAYTQFISSFDFIVGPSYEIVVVGDISTMETKKIFNTINTIFAPNKIVVLKTPNIPEAGTTEIPDFMKDLKMINNKSTVYVCSNYNCNLPTNNINEMLKLLN